MIKHIFLLNIHIIAMTTQTTKYINVDELYDDLNSTNMRASMFLSKFLNFFNQQCTTTRTDLLHWLNKYNAFPFIDYSKDPINIFDSYEKEMKEQIKKMIESCDKEEKLDKLLSQDKNEIYRLHKENNKKWFESSTTTKRINELREKIKKHELEMTETITIEDSNNILIISAIDDFIDDYQENYLNFKKFC